MVDFNKSQLWAWDARPYPEFPDASDIWNDAQNWQTGHWLNGRLGTIRIADLIAQLLADSGMNDHDVSQVYGCIDGYVLGETTSARSALEVVVSLYRLSVYEDAGKLVFRSPGRDIACPIDQNDLVQLEGQPSRAFDRIQETDLPASVKLQHLDPTEDFRPAETSVIRDGSLSLRQQDLSAPIIVEPEIIQSVVEGWAQDVWTGRETVNFALSLNSLSLTPGDEVKFDTHQLAQHWRVTKIEEGDYLAISAKAVEISEEKPIPISLRRPPARKKKTASAPLTKFLDIPHLSGDGSVGTNKIAAASEPWNGPLNVFSSASIDGFKFHQSLENQASLGVLAQDVVGTMTTSRWDESTSVTVKLFTGQFSSADSMLVLNGENTIAVRSSPKSWELIQFSKAELIGENLWQLTKLLRGQTGTEAEADLRPNSPPVIWRIRRFVFGLMQPVFAMPFLRRIRWA